MKSFNYIEKNKFKEKITTPLLFIIYIDTLNSEDIFQSLDSIHKQNIDKKEFCVLLIKSHNINIKTIEDSIDQSQFFPTDIYVSEIDFHFDCPYHRFKHLVQLAANTTKSSFLCISSPGDIYSPSHSVITLEKFQKSPFPLAFVHTGVVEYSKENVLIEPINVGNEIPYRVEKMRLSHFSPIPKQILAVQNPLFHPSSIVLNIDHLNDFIFSSSWEDIPPESVLNVIADIYPVQFTFSVTSFCKQNKFILPVDNFYFDLK